MYIAEKNVLLEEERLVSGIGLNVLLERLVLDQSIVGAEKTS